ncbi:MAG: single-stranded DNA-binding protein [Thermotogae bacterium]|nr:single-stranded DNA-binding protein [Thermotogota bacterium]
MNYNKVILVGRITQDPQMRTGNSGNEVVTFSIAVNRNYSKEDKQTDFFRIVCFGKNAEFVVSYIKKGRLLLVDGSLRNNSWTDKEGKQRVTTEIVANRVQPLDKKNGAIEGTQDVPSEDQLPSLDEGNVDSSQDEDNDVPF